jgi:hypothetical protein
MPASSLDRFRAGSASTAVTTPAVMEAPRRPGAVDGEEYRAADAVAIVEAVRTGRPVPPTPTY